MVDGPHGNHGNHQPNGEEIAPDIEAETTGNDSTAADCEQKDGSDDEVIMVEEMARCLRVKIHQLHNQKSEAAAPMRRIVPNWGVIKDEE